MILARHAEALFWAGRQVERIEHSIRLVDVGARSAMHHPPERASLLWGQVLRALGLATTPEAPDPPHDPAQIDDYLFYSAENPGSVRSTVDQFRDNVRAVRDRVPVELWEETNRLWYLVPRTPVATPDASSAERYADVRRSCQAITGVINEAMQRDDGWQFLQIGRMIERSVGVVRLAHHGNHDDSRIDPSTVLRMASSLQAFRRSRGYDDDPLAVSLYLLSEPDLPRSLLTCLRTAEAHVELLTRTTSGLTTAHRLLGRLRSSIEYDPLETMLDEAPVALLLDLQIELTSIAQTIAVHAFDPARATVMRTQYVRPGTGAGREATL